MKNTNKNNFPVIFLKNIENNIVNSKKLWKQNPKVYIENKNTHIKYDSSKLPEHTGQKLLRPSKVH